MNYDITFCLRNCNNKECKRNFNYIDKEQIFKVKPYVSMSDFYDCKEFQEKE